jgi:hypothetical protein
MAAVGGGVGEVDLGETVVEGERSRALAGVGVEDLRVRAGLLCLLRWG